ncbi:MAG TPA: hypothetical protein VHE35_06305 [Kofleriaceae bacterium]|nr:hypothetical protein [Kofleriaceae bacterium]
MSDDERVRAKLAALEAEVKASSAADAERKARARAQVEARRAAARAESDQLRSRQAALVRRQARRPAADDERPDTGRSGGRARGRGGAGDLGSALELARRAADAKQELARPIGRGEKSWLISGGLSLFLGPVGWLYAGSWRESIPAAAGYLMAAAIVTKILPLFLFLPVLMFALPLSGIAGVVYAIGYNRKGKRVRLFGEDKRDGGGDPDRRIGQLGSGDD